jgi:hypothetical protein
MLKIKITKKNCFYFGDIVLPDFTIDAAVQQR